MLHSNEESLASIVEKVGEMQKLSKQDHKNKPETFDSSGLFHFCEGRSFSDAIVVSIFRHLHEVMVLSCEHFKYLNNIFRVMPKIVNI